MITKKDDISAGFILSIIVPSYNISKYVDETLPTYIDDRLIGKIKVLLIDDGAKDNTAEKIKPFVEKYPTLFCFYHKENGGHGSVINYGSKLIDTKYFKVIDGDDYVYPDELIKLVDHLYDCDDDIVVSDFVYEFKNNPSVSFGVRKNSKNNFNYNLHIHNVTYKTNLWIANNILVREHVFYEDAEYVLFPLEFFQSIHYFPALVYRYRMDNPTQSVDPQMQLRHKDDYELVALDLADYVERLIVANEVSKDIQEYILQKVSAVVFGAYELNSAYCRTLKESIKDCRRINRLFRKRKHLYRYLHHNYRRYRNMKLFGFQGIRLVRLIHSMKKKEK